jgi:hypothetical protein
MVLAISCTGASNSPPASGPAASPDRELPMRVHVGQVTYEVMCTPVAEALVDVELPRDAGSPRTRAITGVWDAQAVAVLAGDPKECGVWALGLAEGLTVATAEAIQAEVMRGVERFGVTASPVPREG